MRRKGLFVVRAGTAVLRAIAWSAGHRGLPATPTIALKSAASVAAGGAAATQRSPEVGVSQPALSRAPTSTHALPDWNMPLEEAIPLLREAAESGDTIAQMDLSSRLSGCTEHALRAAE